MGENNKIITSNKRWISDLIGDTYKEWSMHEFNTNKRAFSTQVFIQSETGTGKTSFILNVLLPYAEKNKRHILYLCNRTALEAQIKNELTKLGYVSREVKLPTRNRPNEMKVSLSRGSDTTTAPEVKKKKSSPTQDNSPPSYTTYAKSSHDSPTSISVCSYQSIVNFIYTGFLETEMHYIVFDEAHFFIEDSLFNAFTWNTYSNLLMYFSKSVHIFMSATLHYYDKIYEDYFEFFRPKHTHQTIYNQLMHSDVIFYINNYHNNYQKLFCYNNDDDLIYKINKSSNEEKWLIMVNSRETGKNLVKKITEETQKKAIFISSDSKKTKTWEDITQTSKFISDVLITTKVIDNGVNIKDSALKHIVLPLCEQVDFLQMIGRRRITDDSKDVSIYIENPSVQKICSRISLLKKKLNAISNLNRLTIDQFFNIIVKNLSIPYMKNIWNRRKYDMIDIFYINSENKLDYNIFAEHKLKIDLEFYSSLKKNSKDPDNYLSVVKKWLQLPDDYSINHIYAESCSSLEEFIAYYLNKVIIPEEFELFYSCFDYYFKKYCYNISEEEPEIYNKSLKITKGTAQRKATINNSLKCINFPYVVKKENNCWVLRSIPLET